MPVGAVTSVGSWEGRISNPRPTASRTPQEPARLCGSGLSVKTGVWLCSQGGPGAVGFADLGLGEANLLTCTAQDRQGHSLGRAAQVLAPGLRAKAAGTRRCVWPALLGGWGVRRIPGSCHMHSGGACAPLGGESPTSGEELAPWVAPQPCRVCGVGLPNGEIGRWTPAWSRPECRCGGS